MPNVELLEETMQYIVDHPDDHDQMTYLGDTDHISDYCGTAQCFAGWALTLGKHPELERLRKDYYGHVYRNPAASGLSQIADRAATLLDITPAEAMIMFHSSNSREALGRMVKDLVNGEHLSYNRNYEEES